MGRVVGWHLENPDLKIYSREEASEYQIILMCDSFLEREISLGLLTGEFVRFL